jgi:hypothetical protein
MSEGNEGVKIIGTVCNLRQTEKSVYCGINIYNAKDKVGAFLNAQFIKDAFEPATRLDKKDKIEITSGFITATEYKEQKSLKLIVMGFNNLTNPEGNTGEFQPADDENDLPF